MKTTLTFLLLLLDSALTNPVPETKETNEYPLYPFGESEGDRKTPKEDDGTSPPVSTSIPFTMYGRTYHSLYVNNNGVISFAVPVSEYTPKSIPIADGRAFLAPYWADVNNVLGGDVCYRETQDPKLLSRITSDLNAYFPEISFTALWAFVATWHEVAYFGSLSRKVNTFQAVLTTNGEKSFVMFNYGGIQWTTGAASNGDARTGLGGFPAQAGFNSGDDERYYSIPTSCTPEIINIGQTSNVGLRGRWVFEVDDFKVTGVPKELMPKEEEQSNVFPALTNPVPETKETNEFPLYPYGESEGDRKTPKEDDGTSPPVSTSIPFTMYGKTYHSLYVNNNGVISFAVPVSEYTPKSIPIADGRAFLAPYWADVNNVLGGDVCYRETQDPKLLSRITSDLNAYFPEISFTARWAFVATWHEVAYFGSLSRKVNTFQAVLSTNGEKSFVMFNYGGIQWTTGAASNGDPRTGLGGFPAQAGFNSGDDKRYYSIPTSRTPEIINIGRTSNVGLRGRWVFEVGDFKVTGVPKELMPKGEKTESTKENLEVPEEEEPEVTEEEESEVSEMEEPSEQDVAQVQEPQVPKEKESGKEPEVFKEGEPEGPENEQSEKELDVPQMKESEELMDDFKVTGLPEELMPEEEGQSNDFPALTKPVPETKETNEYTLYPYGETEGDRKTPKEDDGTSPPVSTSIPFTMYGKTYRSIYVNNNGVISFAVRVSEYTPKSIPIADGRVFLAPYWADVNNVLGGDVYYRETQDPKLLSRITSDLNEYFPEISFTAHWAFVATWHEVAYFGSLSRKVNTFQAVLTTNGEKSFVMFNYGGIQWTTGAASNGDPRTGLGGFPAQAGFNSGDDKRYYSIPTSCTPEIINIGRTSNVGFRGRWVFEVDDFKVTGVPKELMPKGEKTESSKENLDVPEEEEPEVTEEEESEVSEMEEPSEQDVAQVQELQVPKEKESGKEPEVFKEGEPEGPENEQSEKELDVRQMKESEELESNMIVDGAEPEDTQLPRYIEDKEFFPHYGGIWNNGDSEEQLLIDSFVDSDACEW